MTNILLQPVEVVRSDIGYWVHPDIANMAFATNGEWELFKQQQNIEIATTYFGDDAPKHVQEAYEDGSPDFSGWNPTAPNGDGWFMVSVFDTEDGPVCWWARRLEQSMTDQVISKQITVPYDLIMQAIELCKKHGNDALGMNLMAYVVIAEEQQKKGYVLVPKKPTKNMINQGYHAHDGFFTNGAVVDVWEAMIAAAPEASQ